ncbi:hypothetical protein L0337_26485 [candidate division KSB1 bacterium]|nr:hypothetical protein [candidate division KSB1 bacterium]
MSFIEKLLELLSLTKEHWIAILLAIIIAGTIGGRLYVNSLQNRIKSLEFINTNLTFQLQEQRERDESFFEQYKKFLSEQVEQLRKQAAYYKDLYLAKLKK